MEGPELIQKGFFPRGAEKFIDVGAMCRPLRKMNKINGSEADMTAFALAIYGVPFMDPRGKHGESLDGPYDDYSAVPGSMIRDRLETFDADRPWEDGTYIAKRAGGDDSNDPVLGARLRVPEGELKHSILGGMRLVFTTLPLTSWNISSDLVVLACYRPHSTEP